MWDIYGEIASLLHREDEENCVRRKHICCGLPKNLYVSVLEHTVCSVEVNMEDD